MAGLTVPPDPGLPPDGWQWAAAIDGRWRLCAAAVRCRSCDEPAVAELLHTHAGTGRWWAYCPEHMYGHWLQGSRVWGWTLEPAS